MRGYQRLGTQWPHTQVCPERTLLRRRSVQLSVATHSRGVGPLAFNQADHDLDGDVLHLHLGQPQPGEGEETLVIC
jgi:hypothetical protein